MHEAIRQHVTVRKIFIYHHHCELSVFTAFDGYTWRELSFGSDLEKGNKHPQVSLYSTFLLLLWRALRHQYWHRKHRMNLFQGRPECLSSSQKKVKGPNGTGLQKWKARARTRWTTMGITCTKTLGQAMLSMSQSINTVHRNSVGCLDLKVKGSGFSVHLLTWQMRFVGGHVASSVGEGCDVGESRRGCGSPEWLSARARIKRFHLFTLSLI